jgi:two-component system chemotaxis response regulator CheY
MATVLIADDAAFMRMRSATLLKELGHEVIEAENGEEAVALYGEHSPDAVLLDITMPIMDGLEALRAIVAQDPSAKVAMVTAMGQQQVIMEAIKAGAKDFVVKPFDAARIEEALWKLVR